MSAVLRKFKMASLEEMVMRIEDMEDSLADLRTKSNLYQLPAEETFSRKKSRSFNLEHFLKKMPFNDCSKLRKIDELESLLDSQMTKLSERLEHIEKSINRTKSRLNAEKSANNLKLDFCLSSGRPLGMSTGEIADDQIEASDFTAPELR
ncbi:Oidioi.mRNA.OKI2018_I69.chr2.g5153.t1.cds [Oikopleura dioica]|uniref:Oidioi.mRNA.OKI2018_I69.chr2.g5153.t1.cds n=1 Tax=Oikopleura dioica TaxID=34765 RepID=A0ABN7T3V4_OIKDI|nr:Oidioi.mRNA.OKI2018_I69.chr2.g5153.t1.cds [Oikopleura dioica]